MCDEDEQINDGNDYMLSIDSEGKNCNMLLRLDASDSDVSLIQNFAVLIQFLLSQKWGQKNASTRIAGAIDKQYVATKKIYTEQQQN